MRTIHVKNPDELAKEFGFSEKKNKKKQKRILRIFLSDEEDSDNNFNEIADLLHSERCHYCTLEDLPCDFNGSTCEKCRKNGISCMKYNETMDNAVLHYKMIFGDHYERLGDFNNRLLFQEKIVDRQRKEYRESGEVHDRNYHLAKMAQERSGALWSKKSLKSNKRVLSSSTSSNSNANNGMPSKRTRSLRHNYNNNNL
jgi:hypothetical protein